MERSWYVVKGGKIGISINRDFSKIEFSVIGDPDPRCHMPELSDDGLLPGPKLIACWAQVYDIIWKAKHSEDMPYDELAYFPKEGRPKRVVLEGRIIFETELERGTKIYHLRKQMREIQEDLKHLEF